MLTRDVLKNYLLEMPRGHIFDLTYTLFADLFPPGEPDASSREQLRLLAGECDCDIVNDQAEGRFELTRRRGGIE
jgi:hypothetical protein